jgi:hypothetical protein
VRALTLTQPWATLVAAGEKRIETRSWSTPYRGLLAIHAAKGFPPHARALCSSEPFAAALRREGLGGLALLSPQKVLPLGSILAVANLADVCSTNEIGGTRRLFGAPDADGEAVLREAAFGDYSRDRYAWFLEDVVRLPDPVPAKGELGLWTPDPGALALLTRALAGTVRPTA